LKGEKRVHSGLAYSVWSFPSPPLLGQPFIPAVALHVAEFPSPTHEGTYHDVSPLRWLLGSAAGGFLVLNVTAE
jgi:hypothetical protein